MPVLIKSPKACRLIRFHSISVKICCPLSGCRTHRADTASDRGTKTIWFSNTSGSAELKSSTKLQHSLLISLKGAVLHSLPAPLSSLHERCLSFSGALLAEVLLLPPLPAELGQQQAPCARNDIPLQGGSSLQDPRTVPSCCWRTCAGGKLSMFSQLPVQAFK